MWRGGGVCSTWHDGRQQGLTGAVGLLPSMRAYVHVWRLSLSLNPCTHTPLLPPLPQPCSPELTEDQFTDLCILCGCDYCSNIKGIGGHTALKLIKQHGSLGAVLEALDPAKYPLPQPYPWEGERPVTLLATHCCWQ